MSLLEELKLAVHCTRRRHARFPPAPEGHREGTERRVYRCEKMRGEGRIWLGVGPAPSGSFACFSECVGVGALSCDGMERRFRKLVGEGTLLEAGKAAFANSQAENGAPMAACDAFANSHLEMGFSMAACDGFAKAASRIFLQTCRKLPSGSCFRVFSLAKASQAAIERGKSRSSFANPAQVAMEGAKFRFALANPS